MVELDIDLVGTTREYSVLRSNSSSKRLGRGSSTIYSEYFSVLLENPLSSHRKHRSGNKTITWQDVSLRLFVVMEEFWSVNSLT